jgi:hypothetical protein
MPPHKGCSARPTPPPTHDDPLITTRRLDEEITKAVVYLDPEEFKTTWLGNKSIYRTRMAMASGGELIVLAPAVERFGEDMGIDEMIRKCECTSLAPSTQSSPVNPSIAS